MVSTLILSYSACVPINFTQTMPTWYWISATNLYLFPPILKTTLLLPQILALPNWFLISCGDCHSAFIVMSYQASNGACASSQPGFSQNVLIVRFAITRIKNAKRYWWSNNIPKMGNYLQKFNISIIHSKIKKFIKSDVYCTNERLCKGFLLYELSSTCLLQKHIAKLN